VQNPVALRPRSLPQPDLAVLLSEANERGHGVPEPPDTLLVIEVADSTLDWDRRVKMKLYARAGVAQAWLVDVGGARVEVYGDPSSDGYRSVRTLGAGCSLVLPHSGGREIEVSRIFG